MVVKFTIVYDRGNWKYCGKRILAPPKDIKEVKNAYEIYEKLTLLNPYSIKDLHCWHVICLFLIYNLLYVSDSIISKVI